jgi:hypothetical protein
VAGGILVKICKAPDRNRLFFRKVFMPVTASKSGCRNYGMMFLDQWWYDKGSTRPFKKFLGKKDMNRKRCMKNTWKRFFRNNGSSAYKLNYMWWNGGEE